MTTETNTENPSGKIGGFGATITATTVTATGEVENFTATPRLRCDGHQRRHVTIHFEGLRLTGTITTIGCKLANASLTTNELEST